MQIKNVKNIQAKAKRNTVRRITGSLYEVTSATSGNRYNVRVNGNAATCSCDWAKYRPGHDQRCGCSHAVAVFEFIAEQEQGRTVSAWGNVEDAQRQHRPLFTIGDGVVLTTRLVSLSNQAGA